MHIAAVLTSLPLDFAEAVTACAALGFTHVDVVALSERPAAHLDALAETGVLVSCASIGRNLPEGLTADALRVEDRRAAAELMQEQIADAARLGATHCYLVPGTDTSPDALARFTDTCATLASFARGRFVTLCVEHFPGRALPSVAATLKWLERAQLDDVHLLLDVGHCLISEEDPSQAVVRAGARLGYVHFDDNDSVADLHWPLLTGRLTADMVDALVAVLRLSNYGAGLGLELSAKNADPLQALREGKVILEKALG
jgi:sugar phosphate isomerase/epimerase